MNSLSSRSFGLKASCRTRSSTVTSSICSAARAPGNNTAPQQRPRAQRPTPQLTRGSSTARTVKRIAIGVGGLLVVLIVFGAIVGAGKKPRSTDLGEPKNTASAASPKTQSPAPVEDLEKNLLTEGEKRYIGAEIRYLQTVNEEDTRLATIMAGASNGTSTLEEIKTAIETARSRERSSYSDDYHTVPVPRRRLDSRRSTRRSRDARPCMTPRSATCWRTGSTRTPPTSRTEPRRFSERSWLPTSASRSRARR